MNWQGLAQKLESRIEGRVLAQAPLKNYTTWRVGGPADLLVIPRNKSDVREALGFARNHCLPVTVIGNGSNLLVLDGGIRGLALKIGNGLNSLWIKGDYLMAEAGALLPALARQAAKAGLSGMEFAVGIPATLGGAVVMNAGAFGEDIGSLVREIEAIRIDGTEIKWRREELSFGYRSSNLQGRELVVLKAKLQLVPAPKEEINARMESNITSRRMTQPLELPTAGSVFRNPPGHHAGKLIEAVGLKGYCVGDAQVSMKHANFIINRGNATGRDIRALIELIQQRVFQEWGIFLVPEVMIVGEEG